MPDPVPIRPECPISAGSDAMRFCADAVAEFITDHGSDPATAVLILFDKDAKPTIHFTGATASNLCLVGGAGKVGIRDSGNIQGALGRQRRRKPHDHPRKRKRGQSQRGGRAWLLSGQGGGRVTRRVGRVVHA